MPAFLLEDVVHALQAVKTQSPIITLDDFEKTIELAWSAIKEDKHLKIRNHKKKFQTMATEYLKKELRVHAEETCKPDAPLAIPSQVKQPLKRKPDAPVPKPSSQVKKIRKWLDSATATKLPKILNRSLTYQRLLQMEKTPRSRETLKFAWNPSLIQGIDLLLARYSGKNILKDMLKLTELCGMYCILDPIDAQVVSCAIVERNHFREQFDKVPDNGKDKYKVQPSFHCWIVHYHSAHSATLRQLLQQVGNDIQTENKIVVGGNTSYIYMTQPTGTTSYKLKSLDIQQEYKSIESYGFIKTREQSQAWEVTNSKLRNDKKESFTVSYLPCRIPKFRYHCFCEPSRHTIKKMFPGNVTEVAAFPSSAVEKENCPVFLLDPYFGWKRSVSLKELANSEKIMKDVTKLMQMSEKLDRVQIMTIRHVGASIVASMNRSCVWISCCKLVSLVNPKKGTKMFEAYKENPLEYQDLRVMKGSGSEESLRTKLMQEYQVQLQYLKKDGKKVSRMDIYKVLLDGSINKGFYLCTLLVGKSLQGGASHAIGIDMSRKLIYAPDMKEPLALTAQSLSICMDDSTEIVVTMAVELVHVYCTI
jgi:hypothetical protein